jgi:hypothetical protein
MTCRYPDCRREALPDQSRCDAHRMRWTPGAPVEAPVVSPWVKRALAHKLPPKAVA